MKNFIKRGTDADIRRALAEICAHALDAKLSVDELRIRLPAAARQDPFYDAVAWSISDAVEHVPGKWLTGGIDYEAWYGSEMHVNLYLHCRLLNLDRDTRELLVLRGEIAALRPVSIADVDQHLGRVDRR
jgi:hypothetical protein